MARSGGCRLLRAGRHWRLRWKSPYNERNLECTRSPNALCPWSNLTNTLAAHRHSWRPFFRSAGPAPKEINLSLAQLHSEILTIFLCTPMRVRQSLKQTTATMLKDLKLFSSVCIAQFIVWRTLRRNRKEREFRLKRLTLVHNATRDWREAANF